MLKTSFLTAAAVFALGAAPAFAQAARPADPAKPADPAAPARSASQAGAPAAANVAADAAVAVVIDPQTRTAVIVPVNPQADVSPEVTATLAALYATGKVKPGQVGQIVIQRGDKVTEVIANAPVP